MATTKSSAKASPDKRPAPASTVTAAKAKLTANPEPVAKAKPVPKATPKKVAAKPPPKAAGAKSARSAARKKVGIPAEQRRNYVEMAAYYIAERRGFGPGNLLEDWVQAEAEIDRLLAEGLLGG